MVVVLNTRETTAVRTALGKAYAEAMTPAAGKKERAVYNALRELYIDLYDLSTSLEILERIDRACEKFAKQFGFLG